MTNQCRLSEDATKEFEIKLNSTDFIETQTFMASPYQTLTESPLNLATKKRNSIRLNLEDLKCFEVIERQYQHCGIILRNAIALHPSNPAFPPHSGSTVLLAAPKGGFMEILFQQPARFFSAYITSSQRTILTAYDQDDQVIARTEMRSPNLAGSDSSISPNHQLSVNVPNIARVSFYAFDGQLTIDDLSFGF